jgi:hypothetical protein
MAGASAEKIAVALSGRLDLGEKGVRKALGLPEEPIAKCRPPLTPA